MSETVMEAPVEPGLSGEATDGTEWRFPIDGVYLSSLAFKVLAERQLDLFECAVHSIASLRGDNIDPKAIANWGLDIYRTVFYFSEDSEVAHNIFTVAASHSALERDQAEQIADALDSKFLEWSLNEPS